MNIELREYNDSYLDEWEKFCFASFQGTFLHTRKFLSYHKNKFFDKSLLIFLNSELIGLFPAAVDILNPRKIVSHPGITYGGILHGNILRGNLMMQVIELIFTHYKKNNYDSILYKCVPYFYHKTPAEDDIYCFLGYSYKNVRVDLTSVINLNSYTNNLLSSRRKRNLKSALKNNLIIVDGSQYLPVYWEIVKSNLFERHGVKPTHSLDDIAFLSNIFPSNISCIFAEFNNIIVAGIIMFITETTIHLQYIASSELGRELNALDLLINNAISSAILSNKKWFDFGISTIASGKVLNDGLFRYKSEFGSGGICHQFYEFNLN